LNEANQEKLYAKDSCFDIDHGIEGKQSEDFGRNLAYRRMFR
jgi:hypothetical protein